MTRKKVRQLKEQDFLDFDEFGIFDALYKLCGQLQGGFVRDPHDLEVSLDFSEADYIDKNIIGSQGQIKFFFQKRQKHREPVVVKACRASFWMTISLAD